MLRRLSVILAILALTAPGAFGAGWKWAHRHDSAPNQRLAGWTWDERSV